MCRAAVLLLSGLAAAVLLQACQLSGPAGDRGPAEGMNDASAPAEQPAGGTVPPADETDAGPRPVAVIPERLSVQEGGTGTYEVVLGRPPSGTVTVIAVAPAVLTVDPATLTFNEEDWAHGQTVTVSAARDRGAVAGAPVEVTHVLAGGGYDEVAAPAVLVTVVAVDTAAVTKTAAEPELELASLQVSGGALYPAFDPGIHHYALTCAANSTLHVTAEAAHDSHSLTLLRAAPDSAETARGSIAAQVEVGDDADEDLAVEVTGTDGSVTYVVHCLAPAFPDIAVVTRQPDVSDILLFLSARYVDEHERKVRYEMILDNNGVPRFHRRVTSGGDFRPVKPPGTYRGREVHYQNGRALYAADFKLVSKVSPWDGADTNSHDFLVAPNGHLIGLYRYEARRDLSGFTRSGGTPLGADELVVTGRVREFLRGDSVQFWKFTWRSWDARATIKIPDCQMGDNVPPTLTQINSIQFVDGDIVASIRNCSQVVRIDRGGGTGAVEWKLGGTDPGAASDAEYLEIVGDPAGEFCGQHTPTLTDRDTVLLFDNGTHCIGPRKAETKFSRAVEYDISSGTQAVFLREYRPPPEQGHSDWMGSVYELDNGHWLISWGARSRVAAELNKRVAISEVDPTDGRVLLELHVSKHGKVLSPYRTNWASEAGTAIPLNLP